MPKEPSNARIPGLEVFTDVQLLTELEKRIRKVSYATDECGTSDAEMATGTDGASTSAHHVVGASGAKSSGHRPPYHLIPWDIFADALATRYQMGIDHGYEEDNWRRGLTDRAYVLDRANHTLDHLHRAIEDLRLGIFRPVDDDLAAALWGCVFLLGARRAMIEGHERFAGLHKQSLRIPHSD